MHNIKGVCAFFGLVAIIGFPRIYGTEIPMAILLAPFYIFSFCTYSLKRTPAAFVTFLILLALGLLLGFISYLNSSSPPKNLFFHLVIYSKILLVIFFGYVTYKIVSKHPNALVFWIIFQILVAILSSFNHAFYTFLLGFISPRSADIFQDIFGLRALGLGLFHMDGAITLAFAAFILMLIQRKSHAPPALPIAFSFPAAMLIARSAILPYVMFGLLSKGFMVKVTFLLSVIFMFFLSMSVESGPLYHALELFRNIASGAGARVDSVEHLASMYLLPDSFATYLIGDGFYYGTSTTELEFYMGTDVGYLRILYYSGAISLLIFIAINILYPLTGLLKAKRMRTETYCTYFLASIGVFFVMNAKGIQVMPIFSIVAYYLFVDRLSAENSRPSRNVP